MMSIILVTVAVFLNTAAQFLLKQGAGQVSGVADSGASALQVGLAGVTNVWIFAGLVCYIVSFGVWIGVLARLPVSVAYPLLSLGYVVGSFASYWFLNESLGISKLAGITFILLGVVLLSRDVPAS